MKTTKRHTPKMHIKKGDTVYVISGDDKGKKGRVLDVNTKTMRALVEGVNIVSRHTKPDAKNTQGGIIKKEAPVSVSKLMVLDPKSGKPTRIGRKEVNGISVRYAKKSNEVIK
ncbi:MAG: 50S ribosomal protein L24 [Bacteroidota bacterium]|jgi:large subunit ribosomal protein L24|nr:50S ribosomal protein L24 [Bacteroidota bacterium]GDX48672.1 50S ribosomal protein L24 [Bacteroidota bacterium]